MRARTGFEDGFILFFYFGSCISAPIITTEVEIEKREQNKDSKNVQSYKFHNGASHLRQMKLRMTRDDTLILSLVFCLIFLDACRLLYEYLFEQLARVHWRQCTVAVVSVRLMPRKTMDDLNITLKGE